MPYIRFLKQYLSRLTAKFRVLKLRYFVSSAQNQVFNKIYEDNDWGDEDSRSGPGSNLAQTEAISKSLPLVIADFGVKSMLDIPCGDYFWMQTVHLGVEKYIGAELVDAMVDVNQKKYGDNERSFIRLNITKDALPTADLIFCRDLFVHLSYKEIQMALDNIKRSGSKYLLTTTFVDDRTNEDTYAGRWRPLNLQSAPFGFPEPIRLIDEHCTENEGRYSDKSLGLWEIAML